MQVVQWNVLCCLFLSLGNLSSCNTNVLLSLLVWFEPVFQRPFWHFTYATKNEITWFLSLLYWISFWSQIVSSGQRCLVCSSSPSLPDHPFHQHSCLLVSSSVISILTITALGNSILLIIAILSFPNLFTNTVPWANLPLLTIAACTTTLLLEFHQHHPSPSPLSQKLIVTLQMFTVMTKMVLQTKKEQKDRQMETNNPLRLHTPKKGKGKQKCC